MPSIGETINAFVSRQNNKQLTTTQPSYEQSPNPQIPLAHVTDFNRPVAKSVAGVAANMPHSKKIIGRRDKI